MSITIIIIGVIIFSINSRNNSSVNSNKTTIDPDTGEAVDVSNRSPENNGGQVSKITVLGLDSLSKVPDASISTQQIQAIRDDLTSNAVNYLTGHGDTLKIVTPSFDTNSYNIVANLKYNDTSYAKIYITLSAPSYVLYYLTIDNKTVYKSGNIPVQY